MIDNINNEKETLDNFIQEFKLWISIVKSNLKTFVLVAIIFGSIGVLYAYTRKPFYESKLSFIVVTSSSSNIVSSLANLSTLLNAGGGSPLISLTRLLKIIDSDVIIFNSLFKSVKINDKEDFLINHFIELEDLNDAWSTDKVLSKASFTKKINEINEMSFAQRKAFREIQETLLPKDGDGVISRSYDKQSGVVDILTSYTNESFAIQLTNAIYEEVEKFYLIQSNFTTKNSVDVLSKKLDSIKSELNKKQKSYALSIDRNKGVLLQQDRVDLKNLALEEQMLTLMYGETKKNYETFKFMDESFMPPLLIINYPYSPLEKLGVSKKKWLVIGAFIPSFLLFLYFRLSPMYMRFRKVLFDA